MIVPIVHVHIYIICFIMNEANQASLHLSRPIPLQMVHVPPLQHPIFIASSPCLSIKVFELLVLLRSRGLGLGVNELPHPVRHLAKVINSPRLEFRVDHVQPLHPLLFQ